MANYMVLLFCFIGLCVITSAYRLNPFKRAVESIPAGDLTDEEKLFLIDFLTRKMDQRGQKVERRGNADFGLMSRHYAGSDYARASEANSIAQNPYGPGRRR